jgi:hypothetical protein
MSKIQIFDPSVDLLNALLWQYNSAPNLEGLIQQKQDWYNANQTAFWNDWVRDVFDLRTANDFGLAVWSIILNIPLAITSSGDDDDKPIWGFDIYRENFNNGNFATTPNTSLTTEQKRLVLRLRYFQLVTNGTVPEINRFFAYLFEPLGLAYLVDGYAMNGRYVFGFPLTSDLELVITEYDLLPRPAGVKVDFVIIGEADGWGFGRYHENFNNGNFYHA